MALTVRVSAVPGSLGYFLSAHGCVKACARRDEQKWMGKDEPKKNIYLLQALDEIRVGNLLSLWVSPDEVPRSLSHPKRPVLDEQGHTQRECDTHSSFGALFLISPIYCTLSFYGAFPDFSFMADGMQKSYALVAIFLWVCVCFCSYFSALTILYTSLSRPAVHGNDRFSAAPVLRRWCGVAPVERGSRITSVCSVNEMSPMFLRLWWNESVETKTANLVAKTRLPLVTVVGVFFVC